MKQTCYFKIENNDRLLKVFLSERIRSCKLLTGSIHFHIERVRTRTKNKGETFDASGELENLISSGAIISGYGTEKQVGGKVKSSNRGRKRKSARPRCLLV